MDALSFRGMTSMEIAACFLVTAGTLLLAGAYACERAAEIRYARKHPPPGRLIGVNGRRMHLFCSGSEGPTVVIEQGAGSPSSLWWPMQERIAEFARVCTYDRAGYLWSEPVHKSRSVRERCNELRQLLAAGGIPGPYLLVAHSYGGLIVRDFALRYPRDTAGLVLVDTPDEPSLCEAEVQAFYRRMRTFMQVLGMAARFGLLRVLQRIPSARQAIWFVRPQEYAATADDLASLQHLDCSSPVPGQLGHLPVVILTHGQPFPGPFAALESGWAAAQQRLAALSHQAVLITAPGSNHMIHLDQPELVVDAVRKLHTAASDKQSFAQNDAAGV
jgi:pimeloyl-ACP methyl ester carboxylesterase